LASDGYDRFCSHSGRSMKLATTIIGKATDDIIDKGRKKH
jgi:hypothetical protein